jgi:RNA polymerase sigma factor (sigma-70 family)
MTGPIDSRIPAGWTRQELAELADRELLGIVSSLPRFSQRRIAACELLVSRYRDLVRSCVRRYRHGPELTEDLMQVGYVGLVAAINNFDPAAGCTLASYAHPHITGEIKRYLQASLGRGWRPTGRQHYSDAGTAVWTPAVDISERKDAYLVTVELPGVKADDLEITFEDGRTRVPASSSANQA